MWLIRSHHWFRQWLRTKQARSHYVNQWRPSSAMHICGTMEDEYQESYDSDNLKKKKKIEQLECLCSEDTWCPMTTHTIIDQFILDPKPILLTSSYWIPSQNKTNQNYQIKEFAKTSNFWILRKAVHTTHLLKLLDKVCKYEMDPISIVEDKERTRFCPQTDRRTRWNQYTPFNFIEPAYKKS